MPKRIQVDVRTIRGQHSNQNGQQGKGLIEDIYGVYSKVVGAQQEFPGELHAVTKTPEGKRLTSAFLGPRTNIIKRLARGDKGVNDLDEVAKSHDTAYLNSLNTLKKTGDKAQFKRSVWKADDEFIAKARKSKDDPVTGHIASGMIAAKLHAEKVGILPTKTFSGAGKKEKPKLPRFVIEALGR